MRIVVADKSGIDRLHQLGVDLAEYVKPVDNGIEVHAILSPEESRALRDKGFDVQDAISDQADYARNMAERSAAIRAATAATATTDTLTVLRAEWFTSLDNQLFRAAGGPRLVQLGGTDRRGGELRICLAEDRQGEVVGGHVHVEPANEGDAVAARSSQPVVLASTGAAQDRGSNPCSQ
ncbi:hypothetical protein [Micromonospora chersina]